VDSRRLRDSEIRRGVRELSDGPPQPMDPERRDCRLPNLSNRFEHNLRRHNFGLRRCQLGVALMYKLLFKKAPSFVQVP